MKALVYAKEKVWLASDGKTLVKDGDPSAAILVSRRGGSHNSSRLTRFENAADFFSDEEPKPLAKTPKTPDHMTVRMGKRLGTSAPKVEAKGDPDDEETAESVAALVEAAQEEVLNAKTAKAKAEAKKALKAAEKAQADFEAAQ